MLRDAVVTVYNVRIALDHILQAAGVGGGWYGQLSADGDGCALSSSMLCNNVLPFESAMSDSIKMCRYIRTLFTVASCDSGMC